MAPTVGAPVPGWTPARVPPSTPMRGTYVTVTPFSAAAVDDLWAAFSDDGDETWTYMGYGPFRSRAELAETVGGWSESADPRFVTFDIDGTASGWGAYLRMEPAHGTIEVGHLAFGPALRHSTAATEAMYLMARRAFDELGYRRYEWKCDALNRRSRAAAERLGFTYEGTFRHHMVYKGRNRDTAWYAIVDDDWPAVRTAFEAWLGPGNFDDRGRQIRPLADLRASPSAGG